MERIDRVVVDTSGSTHAVISAPQDEDIFVSLVETDLYHCDREIVEMTYGQETGILELRLGRDMEVKFILDLETGEWRQEAQDS